jgi:glycosyltransferase involved in cell wall biosynthesis
MTYIFWQPVLSILNSSFLRSLSEIQNVILVSEMQMSEKRIKHGFYIPDTGAAKVVVAPDNIQIEELLQNTDAIHIFSGIRAFKMPSKVLKLAVKRKLNIGIFTEPFNWMGLKGKMRFLKYNLLRIKFAKHIEFIIVTGVRGRWCYESAGFKKSIIYDWAYFTEIPQIEIKTHANNKPKLLFIGSIDRRKNILALVDVCKAVGVIDQLTIIGIGPLEKKLRKAIENTKCTYLGRVFNLEVHQKIADSDVLILPSLYDGWGAVINEALMCGTPAIASENCGSSILLRGIRGRVFSIEKNNLKNVLSDFLQYLPYEMAQREEIRNWALQNISGEIAAQYFMEIINHVNKEISQRPVAPWLINESCEGK